MIDIADVVQNPFQWGPYIAVGVAALIAAGGWAFRRVLARIDQIGNSVDQLKTTVAVIQSKQDDAARLLTRRQRKDDPE